MVSVRHDGCEQPDGRGGWGGGGRNTREVDVVTDDLSLCQRPTSLVHEVIAHSDEDGE